MSAPVVVERQGRIAVVRLAHGKVNAFDVELADALHDAIAILETAEQPSAHAPGGVGALVITGSGSAFSAGVDLVRYVREDAAYAQRLLEALERLFVRVWRCRVPTVAALNGHALAGGHVLACACDLRLMSAGKGRIGVPEITAGVPFPWLALELVRHAVAPQHLADLVFAGTTFTAEEALRREFVHELVEPEQLLERASSRAAALAANAGPAFELARRQMREPVLVDPRRALHDEHVRRVWCDPATRRRVSDYLARLAAR